MTTRAPCGTPDPRARSRSGNRSSRSMRACRVLPRHGRTVIDAGTPDVVCTCCPHSWTSCSPRLCPLGHDGRRAIDAALPDLTRSATELATASSRQSSITAHARRQRLSERGMPPRRLGDAVAHATFASPFVTYRTRGACRRATVRRSPSSRDCSTDAWTGTRPRTISATALPKQRGSATPPGTELRAPARDPRMGEAVANSLVRWQSSARC